MLLPRIPPATLFHLITFAILASAIDLAFTKPGFNKIAASGYPYFSVGEDVTVSWTTPWEETTVVVFQNVNGKVYYDILADTNGPDNTTVTWTASGVKGKPLAGATFHFYLQNSNNYNCDTCYTNSRVFQITAATSTSTTRSTPRTTITSTGKESTRMPTSTSSTASAAGAAGSNVNASNNGSGSGDNLSIPLGVGLGAGIPVFLALCGILFMFFHHRRKRAAEREEVTSEKGMIAGAEYYDDRTPPSDDSPQVPRHPSQRYGRPESGALGPWQQNPSPTWEQQQAAQQEEWQRQRQAAQQEEWQRQRQAAYDEEDADAAYLAAPGAAVFANGSNGRARHSSQKYDYIPFQPSMPTQFETAEESRATSRHSWIDQFEFERPGYKNADEISEIRKSIHEAPTGPDGRPRSQKSAYSYHASRASIGDVSEIPQVPQPARGWDAGLGFGEGEEGVNWPLR